jgi:hypothetical protein
VDTQVEQREGAEAKKFSVPDDQDPMIVLCYELVSSGRTFSEILAQAKRLPDLKADGKLANLEDPSCAPEGVASHTSGFVSSADQTTGLTEDPYVQQASTTPAVRPWPSRTKLLLLAAMLTLTLSLSSVYFLLGKARPKSDLALLEQSRELSERLLPMLEGATMGDLPQIGLQFQKFEAKGTTIKLLLAPTGDEWASFYFVGSWPMNSPEGERQELISHGILDQLSEICQTQKTASLLRERSVVGEVTAVTPLRTQIGCWAVVTTLSTDALTVNARE